MIEYKVINTWEFNARHLEKKINEAAKQGWILNKFVSHFSRQGSDGGDHTADYTVIMERDTENVEKIEIEASSRSDLEYLIAAYMIDFEEKLSIVRNHDHEQYLKVMMIHRI